MHEVVLCADEETMRDPSLIGLDGEFLTSQQWLHPISSGSEARDYLRSGGPADEVWVASSNEVDPINLAAALKRDCTDKAVYLIAWKGSGSLLSRASAAGIDQVLGYPEMAARYAGFKRQHASASPRRRSPTNPLYDSPVAGAQHHDVADQRTVAFRPVQERNPVDSPPAPPARQNAAPDTLVGTAVPVPAAHGGHAGQVQPKPAAVGVKKGYVLTVVSASGGTGKSTVSALSALIAARHGYRTVLVDADLQFGDITTMIGEDDVIPVDQVVADPARLDAGPKKRERPLVVSAPERLEHYELFQSQIPGIIDRARAACDVVVVNTGSFWTEHHIQLMEYSSNTLFLMDQRPTSVKAARRALELCSRCGVASHPFLFAVNRCSRNSLLSAIDISCALNGVSVAELKEGGRVVAELTGSGMADKLLDARNDLCSSLDDFLGQVIPAALGPREDAAGDGKAKSRRAPFRRRRKAACL